MENIRGKGREAGGHDERGGVMNGFSRKFQSSFGRNMIYDFGECGVKLGYRTGKESVN